jgi:hypothetical protein
MRQKRLHLRLSHLLGMPLAVEKNIPLDPLQIRLLRPQRQPVKPHHFPALLHKFELRIGHLPFQWPMQPFADGWSNIHLSKISLDNCHLQASNVKN